MTADSTETTYTYAMKVVSSAYMILVTLIVHKRAQSAIIQGPVDETVIQGENITLHCVSDNAGDMVEWRKRLEYDPIFDTINGIRTDPDKYARSGTGLDYSLTVKNTVWGDGGAYECNLYGGPSYVAQLVVLGQPSASFGTLIDGQTAQLRCDVTIASDSRDNLREIHHPRLRAYVDGVLQEETTYEWKDNGPGQESPIFLTVNYTAMTSHHDKQFTCEAFTQQPDMKVNVHELMEIHFPVRDMVLAPRNPNYKVGEYINCTAQGHPEPLISWKALDSAAGARPVSGGQLMITEDMLGNDGYNRWECQAINQYVTEAIKKEIEFTVGSRGQVVIIDTRPRNIAVILGSTAQVLLPCRMTTTTGSKPTSYVWATTYDIYVDDRKQNSHPLSEYGDLANVKNDSWTNYDLVVNTTVPDVASRYRCLGRVGASQDTATAYVLLLESQPTCSQDREVYIDGDNATLSCQVTYHGRWGPDMTWDGPGTPDEKSSGNLVKWDMTLKVQPDNDGEMFTCKTHYGGPPSPENEDATNEPDITLNDCIKTITVHYSARNTTIETNTASVGDILTCVSTANPAVEESGFVWTVGNETSTGSTFKVEDRHEGELNISCCASNTIGGPDCDEKVFMAFYDDSSGSENNNGLVVCIIVTFLVILAMETDHEEVDVGGCGCTKDAVKLDTSLHNDNFCEVHTGIIKQLRNCPPGMRVVVKQNKGMSYEIPPPPNKKKINSVRLPIETVECYEIIWM